MRAGAAKLLEAAEYYPIQRLEATGPHSAQNAPEAATRRARARGCDRPPWFFTAIPEGPTCRFRNIAGFFAFMRFVPAAERDSPCLRLKMAVGKLQYERYKSKHVHGLRPIRLGASETADVKMKEPRL